MNAPLRITVPKTVKKGRKEAGRWARSVTDEVQNPGSDQHTAQPLSQREPDDAVLVLVQKAEDFEEGLQADHTSEEAVKVDAQFAACIPRDDGLLYLVVEGETCLLEGRPHLMGIDGPQVLSIGFPVDLAWKTPRSELS